MEIQEIKVEMPSEELAEFRNFLLEKGSEELELQEIHEVSSGFQREPILIALVVALGGPVLVTEFVSLAKEWLQLRHEEKMIKLKILSANGSKQVSLSELEAI